MMVMPTQKAKKPMMTIKAERVLKPGKPTRTTKITIQPPKKPTPKKIMTPKTTVTAKKMSKTRMMTTANKMTTTNPKQKK